MCKSCTELKILLLKQELLIEELKEDNALLSHKVNLADRLLNDLVDFEKLTSNTKMERFITKKAK